MSCFSGDEWELKCALRGIISELVFCLGERLFKSEIVETCVLEMHLKTRESCIHFCSEPCLK